MQTSWSFGQSFTVVHEQVNAAKRQFESPHVSTVPPSAVHTVHVCELPPPQLSQSPTQLGVPLEKHTWFDGHRPVHAVGQSTPHVVHAASYPPSTPTFAGGVGGTMTAPSTSCGGGVAPSAGFVAASASVCGLELPTTLMPHATAHAATTTTTALPLRLME
jgi:hypothetical protein